MKPIVTVSSEATPIELIFAKKIEDALDDSGYLSEIKNFQGSFGVKSKYDPQALSIHCTQQKINISTGISKQCKIVLKLDLNRPEHDPKVEGLLRHPFLAMKVAKLMDFPSANWSDALKRFWEQHHEVQGMPSGITVKCMDEDRQLSVGTTKSACYLEGKASDLAEVFSGGTPLLQLLVTGKIRGRYTFEQAVVLSEMTLNMMLGDA